MSAIVGYGTLRDDGRVTDVGMHTPAPGEIAILNHPARGDPWQMTTCDPATCKLGGCAPGGPYHQIPHAAMIAAAQVEQAQAAAEQAALDYARKVAFSEALVRAGVPEKDPAMVAALARVAVADKAAQDAAVTVAMQSPG